MKQEKRIASQARKVRKAQYNAPLHERHKKMGAHLSRELRVQYGKRALPVRTGDKVEIMRGKFKGTVGKIEEVNLSALRVRLENVTITRTDGTKVKPQIHPSKLMILEPNIEDPRRSRALERKK